jgi:hypothetical protein
VMIPHGCSECLHGTMVVAVVIMRVMQVIIVKEIVVVAVWD